MANLYDVTGLTYEAKRDPRWFSRAILGGKTISEGYVTVFADIKNDEKLNLMEVAKGILQKSNGNCGWDPKQIVTLSEKNLDPEPYKVNLEQCLEAFRHTYVADLMAPGAEAKNLPATLGEYTMDKLADQIAAEIDEKIWNGTQAEGDFDGFFAIATAAGSQAVGVEGTTLTAANVIGELGKVYAAIPEQAFKKGEVKIFVSDKTARLIKMAAATVDTQVVYPYLSFEGKRVFYLDVEVVAISAILDNTMFATYKENLAFGTDLVSDLTKIEMAPGASLKDRDMIYVKGDMSLGTQILFNEDVVVYEAE